MKKQSRPRIRLGSTNDVAIEHVSIDSGLQFWKLHVYDHIESAVDTQQYCGSVDSTIAEKYPPSFLAAKQHNTIVGIVAGHLSTPYLYRFKGLHVLDMFDYDVVAERILSRLYEAAKGTGAKNIWTLVDNDEDLAFYTKNGFTATDQTRDGKWFVIRAL